MNKYVSIFLDKVCEEIKYKGVYSGISEELESHVNERIDYYVEAGLSEKEASIKAVEQMGDPVYPKRDPLCNKKLRIMYQIMFIIN